MNKKILFGFLLGSMVFTSCSNDDSVSSNDSTRDIQIIGKIGDFGTSTKTTTTGNATAWSANDQILTFMKKPGATVLNTSNIVSFNGKQLLPYQTTTGNGSFAPVVAGDVLSIPVDATGNIEVGAIYPNDPIGKYVKTSIDGNALLVSITPGVDQNGEDADQSKYTVLTAAKTFAITDRAIELPFKHVMSKVQFTFAAGTGVTVADLKTIKVTLINAIGKGVLNFGTGAYTTSNNTDVIFKKVSDTSAEGVLAPGSLPKSVTDQGTTYDTQYKFEISLSGVKTTYTWTPSTFPYLLDKGKLYKHTITLAVKPAPEDRTVTPSKSTIENWIEVKVPDVVLEK